MSIIISLLQICGLLIPALGIVNLLAKEQIKMSLYLLLASVGGLIMNGCYILTLLAEESDGARILSKVEYIGNSLFYIFFVLFIVSYLGIRFAKLSVIPLLGFDMADVFYMFSKRRESLVFSEYGLEKQKDTGLMTIKYEMGTLQSARYVYLSVLLGALLLFTVIKFIKTKRSLLKLNLFVTAFAELVIFSAMITYIVSSFEYNVVPLLSSLALLGIILGVIKGSFLNVIESGRSWFVESMEGALIIVDNLYLYQDSNSYANCVFPELKKLKQGMPVPDRVMNVFDRCELNTGAKSEHEKTVSDLFGDSGVTTGRCYRHATAEVKDIVNLGDRVYSRLINTIESKGKTLGYVLLMTDITEQQNMVEELEKAREEAVAANESKSVFMSNMSHEIRTPMNAIVGMTEILLREDLPERDAEYLMNIRNSGDSLLSIINDILDFSKIEAGKLDIIEAPYEPMSMLNDLSMIFLNRIGQKPVELLYDIDPALPARLNGDSKRIRQIIINIMNNAVKFTEKGHVKLRLQTEPGGEGRISLRFDIEDTGQGIKEEDLGKLFGAYSQVDTKKNHEKEGTGLGLAICKQLVSLMNGTIWVESEYGRGSTFSFMLEQEVMSDQPAAAVKEQYTDKPVWGCFENEYLNEAFRENAGKYGLEYKLFADHDAFMEFFNGVGKNGSIDQAAIKLPSCLFTDEHSIPDIETEERLHGLNINLCVLYNPMIEEMPHIHATVINKPLYALNFCQCINRERIAGSISGKRRLFTARDAAVLIVDDNEMNLKVAKGLLEPLKMDITTARNGKEALENVKQRDFDIVFMDHMMPVMDGVEATAAIRELGEEKYRNLPVIALTANATSQAQELFKRSGFNDFVAKPIMMKDICASLEKWLPAGKIDYIADDEGGAAPEGGQAPLSGADDPDLEYVSGLDRDVLDAAAGVECCGTKELYISLLSDYYKLIDKKRTKIEKCLEDGMIRDVTIEVHALKNTSRMIGAGVLSDEFYKLEKIGNSDMPDDEKLAAMKEKVPAVLEHFSEYKKILAPYGTQQNNQGREASREELIMIITALKDAMENFELDMVDDALKELQGCRLPDGVCEKVQELDDLVADVAMEDVIRVATEIIGLLS